MRGRLLTFSAAFCIVFYRGTRIHVCIPVTVALVVVLFSLSVCMYTLRLSKEDQEAQKRSARKERDASFSTLDSGEQVALTLP